jgi:hypothetical protein
MKQLDIEVLGKPYDEPEKRESETTDEERVPSC